MARHTRQHPRRLGDRRLPVWRAHARRRANHAGHRDRRGRFRRQHRGHSLSAVGSDRRRRIRRIVGAAHAPMDRRDDKPRSDNGLGERVPRRRNVCVRSGDRARERDGRPRACRWAVLMDDLHHGGATHRRCGDALPRAKEGAYLAIAPRWIRRPGEHEGGRPRHSSATTRTKGT
jgi:hypothetical protein